jgi:glycerol-3-phosphate dehydrogenase
MPDSQRLLIDILRWSCTYGGAALNYVEAIRLLTANKRVIGVAGIDRENGNAYEFQANVVVNATGPWSRELATRFDRDKPALFKSCLGWNVLLNRKAPADHAVAVAPKNSAGRTYFLLPWKGCVIAGTGQAPWFGSREQPAPSNELLDEFVDDLNLASPKLNVRKDEILHVFAGLLPATKAGGTTFANREVILDHGAVGGPRGFYSISGVKFTTARRVAQKTLDRIFPEERHLKQVETETFRPPHNDKGTRGIFDFDRNPSTYDSTWNDGLGILIREESVQHLDDLALRRTNLWENPSKALEIAPLVFKRLGWEDSRCREELKRLKDRLGNGNIG